MEPTGIHLVNMESGDYGLPAPGYLFDTGMPEKSTEKARAWALELLQRRKTCTDPFRPVCPVYVVGPRQAEILELVAAVLPPGVEMLREGDRRVFSGRGPSRGVTTAGIFYLIAR
jgi:hypothetical protein